MKLNNNKNTEVHVEPRDAVKRTKSPTDALMSTACLDVYESLTLPQKVAFRIKQAFRPRDSYIEKV
jgi:hypothetical protein